MNRTKTAAKAAVVLLVALLVASCGGSSTDDDQTAATSGEAEPTSSRLLSPLEDALGFASAPGRRQYQLVTRQAQANGAIVQCMRSAGFFYAVGSAPDRFSSGAFIGDESREFAAASGLGITTAFDSAIAADAALAVPDPAATNLDYVASLTPEQSASYDQALVGPIDLSVDSESFEPAGCWGDSFTEMLRMVALIDEFEVQLASLNSRLDSDPRVAGLQGEWSSCMNSAGYSFATEAAMVDDVYARLLDIELVDTNGVTQLASREALDALADYERQVAVASFDCRQEFASELTSLRFDYERQFLNDNRFRIAELQLD